MPIFARALVIVVSLSGASGFLFWGSSDPSSATIGGADVSTLLSRLDGLEQQVIDLNKKVDDQQELIESLETLVTSSRMLSELDQECYMTFFNETGTPTCMVNYHLTAEHGLDVMGDSSFASGGKLNVQAASFYDTPVTFTHPVTFQGNVSMENSVEFFDDVTYGIDSDVDFQGPVSFDNRSDFHEIARFRDNAHFFYSVVFQHGADVTFEDHFTAKEDATFDHGSVVRFRDYAYFHENVRFENNADVSFLDKVVFYDDVTIDGPSSGHRINFDIKDRVDVTFQQHGDMIFDVETSFFEDVDIKQKPCHGKGCSHRPVPELCVDGDILAKSDITVDHGKIRVDTIAPVSSNDHLVVEGSLEALRDITSRHGFVSPIRSQDVLDAIAHEDVTVSSLTATNDITTTHGNFFQGHTIITPGSDVTVEEIEALDLSSLDLTINSLIASTRIETDQFFGNDIRSGDVHTNVPVFTNESTLTAANFAGAHLDNVDLTVDSLIASHRVVGGSVLVGHPGSNSPVLTGIEASNLAGLDLSGSNSLLALDVQGNIETTGGNFVEQGTVIDNDSVTAADIEALFPELDLAHIELHVRSVKATDSFEIQSSDHPSSYIPLLSTESSLTAENFRNANLDGVTLRISNLIASQSVVGTAVRVGNENDSTDVVTEVPEYPDLSGSSLSLSGLDINGSPVLTKESTLTADNFVGADLTSVDLVINNLVGNQSIVGGRVVASSSIPETILSTVTSQATGLWYYDGEDFCSISCSDDWPPGNGNGPPGNGNGPPGNGNGNGRGPPF